MRRTVISLLVVVAIALVVWSCREQLVAPGTGSLPGTAHTLRITPSRLDLTVGGSASVIATLLDGTGREIPLPPGFDLTFTSSAPEVFTTNAAGVTTAVAAGEGVLRAAIGALVLGIPVTVVSHDPRLVIVSGDAQTGAPGSELDLPLILRAEGSKGDPARDVAVDFEVKDGSVQPARVNTNDEGIATVRWTLGKTAGVQSITATSKGYKSVTFAATAVVRPVARVVVAPDTVKLTDVAQTAQLAATARDAGGKDLPAGTFTWSSSNPAVATVGPSGLVTAVGAGTSTVSASLGSVVGTSTVIVTLPVPQSRLAFRPDTLRATVEAGAQVVAAVDVVEAGGLPAASLGTVSCDAPVYEGTSTAWLVVQSCGDSVRVLVQAAALPAGTWRASITVRGTLASNSPAVLPVEVVVTAAPAIAALPAGPLTITSTLGTDDGVFNRAFEITNGGGGTLSGLTASLTYATGQPVGWIEKLALDSAKAPTALRFTVRRGALSIGTYDATVHLASSAKGIQPLDIPVHMVVKASAARLGLSADSVEGVSYTNGPAVRVAVDVVEKTGLGEAALGAVSCSAIIPAENQQVVSCGDSIVVLLSPGGNLVGSEVATVRVSSAFTADTVTLRVTRTAARPKLRLVPDSLTVRSLTNGAAVRVVADLVIDVPKGAPAYPEQSLGALQCTVQAPAGAPTASVVQCGDSIAVAITPGAAEGVFRYVVDVQAPNAAVTAVRTALPINVTITAAPIPVIAVTPASPVTITSTIGKDDGIFNQVVGVTNAGNGTLSGVAASLTYATGQPVGWIENLKLDSAVAPTAVRFTVRRGALSIGTYDATLHLTSTVAGVQPLDVAVRLIVQYSAARLGLSADSVEGVSYTNGPTIRVAVDVVERTGLGEAALGRVSCSEPIPMENFTIVSCGDSIVAMLSPGGNLERSEVAIVHVTSAFTADTVTLRLTRTAARPRLRLRPDSLAARALVNSAPIRVAADLVIDVLAGAPAYPEASLGALTCTVQAPVGAPPASVAQCADSVAIVVAPGAAAGTYRYLVDVQAPDAAVTAVRVSLPINITINAAATPPAIVTAPAGPLALTTAYGVDDGVFARVVAITNGGGGSLAGLAATVTYAPTQPVGWIENLSLDSATAPTALRFTVRRDTLLVGTYDATVHLTSTVAGVQPLDVAVSLIVQAGVARLVIVSGDAQTGATGAQLALPLVVRAVQANGQPGRDAPVSFVVTEGSVTPPRVGTDGYGIGTVRWTLGSTVGAQSVTASSTNFASVTYVATAVAPAPVPVISAFPSGQLVYNTTYGSDAGTFNRVVDITNSGVGTLSGLAVSVTYAAGQPTGWIENPAFDAPTAPTALRFTFNRGTLAVGTYDATVRLTSTVAGVQPLDIPVRMRVSSTATIGLSPNSFVRRNYTSGPFIRVAAAVIERSGFGLAALGTISCSNVQYSRTTGWARIVSCGDSVVVSLEADVDLTVDDVATIRVTGSTSGDTATLRVQLTASKPKLAFIPDSLVIVTTAGAGSAEATAEVVEANQLLTTAQIRDVRCTLNAPSGAPAATVTSCFTDAVTVRVAPGATAGRFVYTVLVEAPNGVVPITPGVLRAVVTIAAPPQPFAAAVIYGTCAIDKLDKLYCWGKNASGEVGDGTTTQRDFPTPVKSSLSLIVQLHSGDAMKCGINVAPLIPVCWGQNAAGATGQGTFNGNTTAPAPVAKFTGTSNRLGVGPQNACARENETDLWYCWGSNAYGLLGTGSTETATNAPATPVAFAGISVNDVVIGARHACALGVAYDYRLFCWGDGSLLGNGSTDTGVQGTPVAIPFPEDLPSSGLVATSESTCVLSYTSYRLYCWGGNRDGTTGTGGPTLISVPTQVLFPGFPDQVSTRSVVSGDHHICAIVGGATFCWGRNEYGQLGTGDVESSSRPVRIVGDKGFASLAASGSTTCGLTYDGNVWCWGYGLTGELGNGTSGANSPVPMQVLKP